VDDTFQSTHRNQFLKHPDHFIFLLTKKLQAAHCPDKEFFYHDHFFLIKYVIPEEIFIEINHYTLCFKVALFFKISFLTAPQMRQVRAREYQFAIRKRADAISNETGTSSFHHNKKLVFGMRMPGRVEVVFL
jgi:hypothetical protein